ncbi:hypothetical protein PV08_04396 [Exophiala spinifera]|uniref:Ribonucleases P/MRP subunit Pop8-like domain-containing protein n=1 Tax=Exophiala spinifera TaxID=91928 RepID=A0A0D2BEZ8_9EURO|nr:uncharacterized protein PV08_04396 [Exophiala spinifera]KIW17205.1 hypothetical protein PV08_04396 [Exophiala spinifera]
MTATATTFTLRNPPYAYLHLSLRALSPQDTAQNLDLDEITTRSYLTAALQQYLGLTGTAIPIDILKVEGPNAWIRVPKDDESGVAGALAQWSSASRGVNLRIEGRGSWLGGVVGRRKDVKLWSLER